MDKYIAEHFEEIIEGNNVTRSTSMLYLVNNRYYEVEHEILSTSGGAYSTTWNAKRWTEQFPNLQAVQEMYGLHYFY